MATQELIMNSTNVVRLKRLKDDVTRAYLSTATATLDLYDAVGVPVAGAQGLAMPYAAGTGTRPGEYRGTIPASVVLVKNATYDAHVTAVAADGSTRLFHVPCVAVEG